MPTDATDRSKPLVSVVVPTYRRPRQLTACLAGLAGQTLDLGRFEVIVVDDSSGDETPELVAAIAKTTELSLRLLARHGANRGPALTRNLGWKEARADVVAFLDDDCDPSPGWLQAGLAALCDDAAVGVVQGRTRAPEGVDVWGLTDWYVWQIIDGPTAHFEACNIFYRRQALAQTGGFDEDIPRWGEDTELGWKVLAAGWDRAFAVDAAVTHPVERRGLIWYVRSGLRDAALVKVAAAYPAFREAAFWRPWAYRREDAAFAVAAIGTFAAWRWRPAIAVAVPYLWWRRPSLRRPHFLRLCVETPLVDAARLAGVVRGALRHRIFVV